MTRFYLLVNSRLAISIRFAENGLTFIKSNQVLIAHRPLKCQIHLGTQATCDARTGHELCRNGLRVVFVWETVQKITYAKVPWKTFCMYYLFILKNLKITFFMIIFKKLNKYDFQFSHLSQMIVIIRKTNFSQEIFEFFLFQH